MSRIGSRSAAVCTLVCCALLALGRVSPADADVSVPSPSLSTLPSRIWLVGKTGTVADPCGYFEVVVRNQLGAAYANKEVILNFTHAPDLDFAATQSYPGMTVDCATREVRAATDAQGAARFTIIGAVRNHPGGSYVPGPCLVHITCDGVCLADVPASAFDLDGRNGVNANDLSLWLSDFGCGQNTCVADYTATNGVGATDLSHFHSILSGWGSLESGDLCDPLAASAVTQVGGVSLTSVPCNDPTNLDFNACMANRFSEFWGSVTLTGSNAVPGYTGMTAVLNVHTKDGTPLPDHWRFETIGSSPGCPGVALGCNRTRLTTSPHEIDDETNLNCLSLSTAYTDPSAGELYFGSGIATVHPYPGVVDDSKQQIRLAYGIAGCVTGSIPNATPTVVFGLRLNHGPNPALCAGCADASNVEFELESVTLTNQIPGTAGCTCTPPQPRPVDGSHGTPPEVIQVVAAPGDSNRINADGTRPALVSAPDSPAPPARVWLAPPAPNPSGGGTVLRYALPRADDVRLGVYDVAGRRVRRLLDREVAAGTHSTTWDGRDESGAAVPAAVYFVRLVAAGQTLTRTVVVR